MQKAVVPLLALLLAGCDSLLAHRVETNLLTLQFETSGSGSAWADLPAAFGEAPKAFVEGTSIAIEWLAS